MKKRLGAAAIALCIAPVLAMAQDDEMIFSVPTDKLADLMLGLRHYEDRGSGYTKFAFDMRPEYPLSDLYRKVGKMVGLDVE